MVKEKLATDAKMKEKICVNICKNKTPAKHTLQLIYKRTPNAQRLMHWPTLQARKDY
jgi:hypothetical protein